MQFDVSDPVVQYKLDSGILEFGIHFRGMDRKFYYINKLYFGIKLDFGILLPTTK